jgi:hypothetical protein
VTIRVDPRAWNLFAGLSLVVGACNGSSLGSDGGTSGSTNASTDGSESSEPECKQNSDCPPGHPCLDGTCYYPIALDGYLLDGTPWECTDVDDCGPLSLCLDHYCASPIPELPGCPPTDEFGIPLAVGEPPLALSFVDLDADGAAELVAATPTELHAFESGSNVASISARVYESSSIAAMVAGDFAPAPGQDLALLVDDTLLVHAADGIAGFDAPSEEESPQLDSTGMLAGALDGAAATDLLVWGAHGATVLAAELSNLHDATLPIEAAAFHGLSTGSGRFILRDDALLYFFALDGVLIATTPSDSGSAAFITAIANPEHLELHATVFAENDFGRVSAGPSENWALFELRELDQVRGQWGVLGAIWAMNSGDLDGDDRDEVALMHDSGVTLIDNLASGRECTAALDLEGRVGVTRLAIGDHDGDGDSELAVAFADGEILLFDGEG